MDLFDPNLLISGLSTQQSGIFGLSSATASPSVRLSHGPTAALSGWRSRKRPGFRFGGCAAPQAPRRRSRRSRISSAAPPCPKSSHQRR